MIIISNCTRRVFSSNNCNLINYYPPLPVLSWYYNRPPNAIKFPSTDHQTVRDWEQKPNQSTLGCFYSHCMPSPLQSHATYIVVCASGLIYAIPDLWSYIVHGQWKRITRERQRQPPSIPGLIEWPVLLPCHPPELSHSLSVFTKHHFFVFCC